MTTKRTDDELLAQLAEGLRAGAPGPDDAAWAGLDAALAELAAPPVVAPIAVRGRRGRRNVSVLALSVAAALTVGGAAAAAVATNTLPGPLRSIAFTLGLPVTSPALYQAQQEESRLRATLHAHLGARAHSIGETLAAHIKSLDPTDQSSIAGTADGLLREAGVEVSGVGPAATTTTTEPRHAGGDDASGDGTGSVTTPPPGDGGSNGSSGAPSGSGDGATVTTTVTVTVPTLPPVGGDD